MSSMKNKKIKFIANIVLVLICIGLVIFVLRGYLGEITKAVFQTNPFIFVVVLGLGMIYQLLEGENIKLLVSPLQSDFRLREGVWGSGTVAFFRVISFGAMTFLSEVFYYNKKEIEPSKSVGLTVLRLLFYKVSLFIFGIACLLMEFLQLKRDNFKFVPAILTGLLITAIIIIVLLLFSMNLTIQAQVMWWIQKIIRNPKLREKIDRLNLAIFSLREVMEMILKDKSLFMSVFFYNCVKLAVWYSIPFITFLGQKNNSFFLTFSLVSFAVVLAGVIPTPGGIGGFEFVYVLLFKPYFGMAATVASLILYRLASYFLPFFIGMFYQLVRQQKNLKKEYRQIKKSPN